jgi:hypothetical protein
MHSFLGEELHIHETSIRRLLLKARRGSFRLAHPWALPAILEHGTVESSGGMNGKSQTAARAALVAGTIKRRLDIGTREEKPLGLPIQKDQLLCRAAGNAQSRLQGKARQL